jgi:hypothetical protein
VRFAQVVSDDEDDEALALLAGCREGRRRCAFCSERAIVQCDGDRCIRQICNEHRTCRGQLEFCPPCERKQRALAATPEQIALF